MDKNETIYNQIEGGLVGLLIGDALGVPYEFHSPDEIPALLQINYEPPVSFQRAHNGILPATWSDDGAQALCLLASLLHCKRLDIQDFAKRLINWHDVGYMAVDHIVFDIGITTAQAINRLKEAVMPQLAGSNTVNSNGNGSLMRVLPLALWHQGTDGDLVKDAMQQSLVTHGHIRAQLCCALYCLIARNVLYKRDNPWDEAVERLHGLCKDHIVAMYELEAFIFPELELPAKGTGYVVDSLRAVKEALAIPSYQEAVRYAIALGHDTDTTACIVGGIVGLRDGLDAIPKEWREQLRGQDLYSSLLSGLLKCYR